MKKIAYILGAVVLATGSVSSVAAFADASTQAALASSLVSAAKSVGAQDQANGVTDQSKVTADVASAAAAQVEAAVAAGDSNADIQAAMNEAMNAPGLTAAEAAGLNAVNSELAQIETTKPGGIGAGTGGGGGAVTPPAPPPPAAAGTGYVSQ